MGDENYWCYALPVEFCGGEGPVFESAGQHHDGVGFLHRLIDDPGVGQTGEERGAENETKSDEKDYKTTGPQDHRPQTGPFTDYGATDYWATDHGLQDHFTEKQKSRKQRAEISRAKAETLTC